MKLYSKIPIKIVFPILLIWQILLTFQGLDLADTGFHLTAFRFIFEDPYSVQYSMMFWLSDACGALWMKIWPDGGLYWFKLGWVVVISSAFMLYFSLLKPLLGKQNAVIGLAITLIFILQGGPECLNYDIFSTLGFALGILFLYNGLIKNRLELIILSGLVFGMSVFFKLSNITSLAFFLLIPFFSFLNKENFTSFLKKSMSWLIGISVGMVAILILIWRLGQLDLFLNNLSVVSSMGKDIHASHGIKPMLLSYLAGYSIAFVCLIVFMLAVWFYIRMSNKFLNLFTEKNHLFLFLFTVLLIVVFTIFLKDVFWSKVRYLFIALMVFQGIVLITDKKCRNEIRILSLAGLILLLIAPLGSDSGLGKSTWGMWILGSMILTVPIDLKQLPFVRPPMSIPQSKFVTQLLAIIVLFTAIVYAWEETYFDEGSRISKIYPIEHPQMRCIYTSKERARTVNELILGGFPKVKDEKYLLAFIEIPMLNYLSDKKPFISTSWPKLYYNPKTFRQKLEEALQRRKAFPAIIRQKQNTMMADWPGKPEPDYLLYPTDLSKWPEHGKILNEFIAQNNYQVVWENDMFQLLVH
jgi:hypothetical protein